MATEGVLVFVLTMGGPLWLLAEEIAHRFAPSAGARDASAHDRAVAGHARAARGDAA